MQQAIKRRLCLDSTFTDLATAACARIAGEHICGRRGEPQPMHVYAYMSEAVRDDCTWGRR